jgi:DNA-binding NtrC family response regulator
MGQSILIVEDELLVANNLRTVLQKNGYDVTGVAPSVEGARQLLKQDRPTLVLLDIYLKGDGSGIDLAVELNEKNIPFVYISANSSQEVLEAAKATGPYGFIVKPFRENDLLVSLEIAFYRHEYQQQTKPVPFETAPAVRTAVTAIPDFIGESAAIRRVFEMVGRVAPANTSVLILGESGTGKEKIAAQIHRLSLRRNKPFVVVNCAALPMHLIESELFGHEKGAFTGAFEKKIGKFERAEGGTLFLDEIGEMPPDLQVKLLRVLQEKEIERIGGNGSFRINVRIIAATNRNLEKEIAEGRFRLDLYYRLYLFPIFLPPLRERKEDIPLLAEYFLKQYASMAGKDIRGWSPSALEKLSGYAWPGNVRELQGLVERNVLLNSGKVINDIELPRKIDQSPEVVVPAPSLKTMEEMERDHILEVLKFCNYRVSGPGGAAQVLNIPPTTLSYKMKKLGIVKTHTL